MNVKVEAQLRSIGKKSDMKNLRKQGFIPAVIYGEGKEGVKISLERIPFMKIYKTTIGEVAFFDIKVDSKSYTTIIKARQVHPVSREYMHLDFMEIHKGKAIVVNVPIKYTGEAVGLAAGGVLDVIVRKLEISCLPKDIPDDFVVDISNLDIGDSIHLSEIDLKDLECRTAESSTLVAVRAPRKVEELEVAEEDEIAEGEAVEGEEGQESTEEKSE